MGTQGKYGIGNGKEYNEALVNGGDMTLWFDEDSISHGHSLDSKGTSGRPKWYNDAAIECAVMVKSVFHLTLRALEGFLKSLKVLMDLPIQIPDYSTICRRQKSLQVDLERIKKEGSLHIVMDSTGLKVFGEGEWKVRQHGVSKRRTWRKLHWAVNEATGEIVARSLTENNVSDCEEGVHLLAQIKDKIHQTSADGAYDTFHFIEAVTEKGASPIIPPRTNAQISKDIENQAFKTMRNQIILEIQEKGRPKWKQDSGYHRRSLAETMMFRFKKILGDTLAARTLERQKVETFVKCNVLNRMTSLGMPESYLAM